MSETRYVITDPTKPSFWDYIDSVQKWKRNIDWLLHWASNDKKFYGYKLFRPSPDYGADCNVDADAQVDNGRIVFQYKYSNISSDRKNRLRQVRTIIKDVKDGTEYKRRRSQKQRREICEEFWKDVAVFLGVTNVQLKKKEREAIKSKMEENACGLFKTDLIDAANLALLAGNPHFMNIIARDESIQLKHFKPIEKLLEYTNINKNPKFFRKENGYIPLGVDFGPLPPYFKKSDSCVITPMTWQSVFERIAEDATVVWIVARGSVGKTTCGLWLGYRWLNDYPNWNVLYINLVQYQHFNDEELRKELREDLSAIGKQTFIIFDNIHVLKPSTRNLLSIIDDTSVAKCVITSRDIPEIDTVIAEQKQELRDKLLYVQIGSESDTKFIVKKYVERDKSYLANDNATLETLYNVFANNLIAIYYALEDHKCGENIDENNAALGYYRDISEKLKRNAGAYAVMMVVSALSRFEVPTEEGFLYVFEDLEQYDIGDAINALTEKHLLNSFRKLQRGKVIPYLMFPHEVDSRLFKKMCEIQSENIPNALSKFRNSCKIVNVDWANALIVEYKRKRSLDINELIFKGYIKEMPKLIIDCIEYMKSLYASEIEHLADFHLILASVARRKCDESSLELAFKYLDSGEDLINKLPHKKGWFLYEKAMVEFYRNNSDSIEIFDASVDAEQAVDCTYKALISEAQRWVVSVRLNPLIDMLNQARAKLMMIMNRLERELNTNPKASSIIKRWIANCKAHIAEMSIDLDERNETIRQYIEEVRNYAKEYKAVIQQASISFIEGKYYLATDPDKAVRLLEFAIKQYKKHDYRERIAEMFVALGDAYCKLGNTNSACRTYSEAIKYSEYGCNKLGKRYAQNRISSMCDNNNSYSR